MLRVAIVRPDTWYPLLSAAEREKAAQITHSQRRSEFICCRGLLRLALGRELGDAPERIPIVIDSRGKPRLRAGEIAFSIAHTQGLGLVALSSRPTLGIDAELAARRLDVEAVASELLSQDELVRLDAVPAEHRKAALLRAWVRHEATTKATGQGLIATAMNPVPPSLTIADLELGVEYVGAVAADGPSYNVTLHTLLGLT